MISIEHVSKAFGPVLALDDVSLRIEAGERVAFVGSNGSGKTTLLRALLGLLRVRGRITVGGIDVAKHPEQALRSIAYIPQISPPLEAEVAEVVGAYAALRNTTPAAVAMHAARLGLDLPSLARGRFRDLSGGMKQKLLSAMALATHAEALVCDEPTANLDAGARAAFFQALRERKPESVVILCSHRVAEVRHLVDRVIELRDGRIERDASLGELLSLARAFRVEVTLRDAAQASADFLRAEGFMKLEDRRFGALLTQAGKMSLVERLVRDHQDAVSDLSVYPLEELELGSAENAGANAEAGVTRFGVAP